jgi:hypothetical protein
MEVTMRMFIGMVFGCLLTVAAAYVHDSMATPKVANGLPADTANTLVNWDVAARKWGYIRDTAHTAWMKLQSATKNGA